MYIYVVSFFVLLKKNQFHSGDNRIIKKKKTLKAYNILLNRLHKVKFHEAKKETTNQRHCIKDILFRYEILDYCEFGNHETEGPL